MPLTADIVICGAGITGIASAYYLNKAGFKNVILVDERAPLTLTSNRSTECYRNWWPDPAMLSFMNRSIDLMDELSSDSHNMFHLNRRGYLFVTAREDRVQAIIERSRRISSLGAGPLRIHRSNNDPYNPLVVDKLHDAPDGADLLLGTDSILKYYPYLNPKVVAALHVRRAGWLSAQQLGMLLYESALNHGLIFHTARVTSIDLEKGRIQAVGLDNGELISTPIFLNASGPYLKTIGSYLGEDLPVVTELHLKAAVQDSLGVVGRMAPLLIWDDPQYLPWDEDDIEKLQGSDDARWLTEQFPSGIHTRPEGPGESQTILMLWEYQTKRVDPVWPPPLDDLYPEIAVRGLAAMLPGMKQYFSRLPKPHLDGGYYTRTLENLPLIGRTKVEGSFVIGAVSGYGIMSACAAGELITSHITGGPLPKYAPAFLLDRYDDPHYVETLDEQADGGQL